MTPQRRHCHGVLISIWSASWKEFMVQLEHELKVCYDFNTVGSPMLTQTCQSLLELSELNVQIVVVE